MLSLLALPRSVEHVVGLTYPGAIPAFAGGWSVACVAVTLCSSVALFGWKITKMEVILFAIKSSRGSCVSLFADESTDVLNKLRWW